MTEERLSELLNAAVPPLGLALDSEFVLAKARRRQTGRRRAAVLASMGVVVAGSVGIALAVGDRGTADQSAAGQPCSSPFAGADQEQSVTYPTGGKTVQVTLKVNQHFTAHWHFCGEHGTVTNNGPQDAESSVISASDASIYSSPRPVPSDHQGFARPPEDGVFDVRYVAQRPGTVTLHGKGSRGSDGFIEVTVTPLTAAEGRQVSGSVDTHRLLTHPGPKTITFQPKGKAEGQGYADVHGDGTFSVRLRPGTYEVIGLNEAYNDGKAQCNGTIEVASRDVTGYKLTCTEH